MNIVYEDQAVVSRISEARLTAAYNRMIRLILDAGDITNQTTGKGVLPIDDGVKAVSLLPTKYFLVDVFEDAAVPSIRVFCVFAFIDTENDDIPGGQLKQYLKCFGTNGSRTRSTVVDDQTLRNFASEYLNGEDDPFPIVKETLPLRYVDWQRHLDAAFLLDVDRKNQNYYLLFVRETIGWMKSFRASADSARAWYGHIYKRLCEVFYLEDPDALAGHDKDVRLYRGEFGDGFYLVSFESGAVLCRYQMAIDVNGGNCIVKKLVVRCRELTLIELLNKPQEQLDSSRIDEKINRYITDYEERRYRAFRYYPGRIFDDKRGSYERWEQMETSKNPVCIEFSREELDIIFGEERRLPILVNGAAGSGKSTALYWLFAAYWLQNQTSKDMDVAESCQMSGHPIFLTLSSKLKSHAVRSVVDIIRFSSDYENGSDEKDLEKRLADSMWSFDQVLNAILGDLDSEYVEGYEIQFERFKGLLLGESSQASELSKNVYKGTLGKKYTPELCWHIIRCYIKGFQGRDYYDREKFVSFLDKRRETTDAFVDKESCLYVWDEVWPWYRNLTVENLGGRYWDQQDRVSRALKVLEEKGGELPFPLDDVCAVFCDEVQDFTGVEQSLILRISRLLRYALPQGGTWELPFAFAGDPMQTINPSGFRWEDLKRSIDEHISETGSRYTLSPYQLERNYRSPARIVRWANMVELARKMLFRDKVKPQTPDKSWNGEICLSVRPSDASVTDTDLKQLEDCIILLPCSQSDAVKNEYIQSHGFLSKLVDRGFSKDDMLSVLDAKGMDIARVVLYNFGDTLFSADVLVEFPVCTDGSCKDISFSYALNKVYVGITRATEKIAIVDTETGYDRFWAKIGSRELRRRYVTSLLDENDRNVWEANLPEPEDDVATICNVCQGNIFGDVETGLTRDEKIEEAQRWFENAYLLGNSRQMILAAHRFDRLDKRQEYCVCKGFAKKFEGAYKEAAADFSLAISDDEMDLGSREVVIGQRKVFPYKQRIECWWESMSSWQDILKDPYAGEYTEYRMVSRVMQAAVLDSTLLDEFLSLVENGQQVKSIKRSEQWRMCLEKIASLVEIAGFDVDTSLSRFDGDKLRDLAMFFAERFCERNAFTFCGRLAIRLCVYLHEWGRAYEIITRNGGNVPGVEMECDIVRSYCADWPEYAVSAVRSGQYLECARRWRAGHQEKDELRLKAYPVDQQQGFVDVLIKAANHSSNIDCRGRLEREAVEVAFSLDQWRYVLNRYPDLLDMSYVIDCVRLSLTAAKPDWISAADLVVSTAKGFMKAADVNQLLDSIAAVPIVCLKSAGAGVFVEKLREVLEKRNIAAIWPCTGDDMKRAANVFVKIGMMQISEEFALKIVKDVSYQARPDVRDVAMELYLYARRDFIEKRCLSEDKKNKEKAITKRIFVNEYVVGGDPFVAERQFDIYWDAVPSMSFEVESNADLIYARNSVATSVVSTSSHVEMLIAGRTTGRGPCVVGAKIDEDTDCYVLTRHPFRFTETDSKITIRREGDMGKAVIQKTDWNNQSCNLMDIGLRKGTDYNVLKKSIVIKLPEWSSPIEIVF